MQLIQILSPEIYTAMNEVFSGLWVFLISHYSYSGLVKIFGYVYMTKITVYLLFNYKKIVKYYIKKVPLVQTYISKEQQKIVNQIKDELDNEVKGLVRYETMPKLGLSNDIILGHFNEMKNKSSYNYNDGMVSGAVYCKNQKLDELLGTLFSHFHKSNPLHTNLFPSVRKMEQDIVRIMINLFNGDENACGTFTSGGTESILLACKTYRDMASDQGITEPEIIVSTTAHCAFNKACKYFKIKLIEIPCLHNGLYDLKKLEESINKNTILVVASTPSYNLGIIDQVPEINDIVLKHKVYLHLDACIGSFLINFKNYNYDFTYDGVTSISADFHKYGHSPKGASSILYRNKEILEYQYFIDENWSGGVYATTIMGGSRPGNIVALTYATLLSYGELGYRNNYVNIENIRKHLINKLKDIPELFVYGNPELSIVAIGSDCININLLAEELKKNKWDINVIQNPNGFHFCITSYHTKEIIDRFIKDVKLSITKCINSDIDKNSYSPCIYGTKQKIDDNSIIRLVIKSYLHLVNNVKLN